MGYLVTNPKGATVTIFAPYDCKNDCPFCVNKKEYKDKFDKIEDLDEKIAVLGKVIQAVPSWAMFRQRTYSSVAVDLLTQANTEKQVEDLVKLDKEFTDKKWSETNREEMKRTFGEDADEMEKYYREHEQTYLYGAAAHNPYISSKTLKYVLEQTALVENEMDKSSVMDSAFRNPKLNSEHYDAVIDCFKKSPEFTKYQSKDFLEIEDLSLENLDKFKEVINEAFESAEYSKVCAKLNKEITNKMKSLQTKNDEIAKKQQQIEKAWKVEEGFGRVRGKINKKDAIEKADSDLRDYKRENNMEVSFSKKMKDIDKAWTEHENEARKAKIQADKLTAKQISDYMNQRNG